MTTRVRFAAIVFAVVCAAVSLVPVRTETMLLGRPGDAFSNSRFYPSSSHLGAMGRWTRGDGEIRLPASPMPAVVTLRMTAPDARVPDTLEIVINGVQVHTRALPSPGWHDVAVDVDQRIAKDAIAVRLKSAVTADAAGVGRGVFVERVSVTTGGLGALPRTRGATLFWLTLAWLGIVVCATRLGTTEGAAWGGRLVFAAIILLAFAAVVGFRPFVMLYLVSFAMLCVAVAAAMTAAARITMEWPPLRTALGFSAVAVVLVVLLFPEALKGYVFSQADMLYEHQPWQAHAPAGYRTPDRPPLKDVPMLVYPFAAFAQSRLRQGMLPLWTNAISAGQPFLATYQSALLSPFTLLTAIVPLPQATVVIAVLRLMTAGLGMFLFLRAIGLSRLSAAFGGIAFLLNPFLLVWLEHPLAGVPPWLPWMLLAAERLASSSSSSSAAGRRPALGVAMLAGVTALVLAGGHPHTGMFVAMLGGAYAVARALATERTRRLRTLTLTVVALALGTALVALQVLPFLEYVSLSRAAATRTDYPLNPFIAPASTLITAIVPNFLGHHSWGNFAGPTNYLEQQIYPGIAVWLLAAAGIAMRVRAWRVWFFASAAALAMLVMYGAPGVHELVSSLPLINAASLPRAGIITLGALAVLSAFGVEEILCSRDGARSGRWAVPIAAATVGVVAIALMTIAWGTLRARHAWLDANGLIDFATRWTWLTIWLTAAVTIVALARLMRVSGRVPAGVALCGLVALDLLLFGRGFHPLIPTDQAFPVTPEVARVQEDRELFRVLGAGGSLMPNAAMAYGLQDVRGYDGLLVARYADLLDAAFRYEHHTHFATNLQSPLINLLNVKYVFGVPNVEAPEGWFTKLIDGEAPLYRNNRVLPRAFLVDGYTVLDGNPARRTLRDGRVDFRRVALVEQELAAELRPVPAAAAAAAVGTNTTAADVGRATITSYRDHHVAIETDAPARRLLVLTDVHYPGWHAAIDGESAPILRANFAFRAVPVPAGRHTVTFDYRPSSFRTGLIISGAALLALIGAVLAERRRIGRHGHSGAAA